MTFDLSKFGGIEIVSSPLVPEGMAYLVSKPIDVTFTPLRPLYLAPTPEEMGKIVFLAGARVRLPPPGNICVATLHDLAEASFRKLRRHRRSRWNPGKKRERRQRHLDRLTNRKRKRRAELARRRKH